MQRIFLLLHLFLLAAVANSQDLSQVKYANGSDLTYFSFITDQKILIRISPDGKILEWGNYWDKGYYNYTPGKLQQYMGRVEYYGAEADSINRGKVKSVGTSYITYYSSFDAATDKGKVKSIGRTNLNYYSIYENEALVGKLKSAGNTSFTYYNSYENIALKGKLKSAGTAQITYFTSFDDKKLQGKIKSIGSTNYVWYNSNDRREYQGALKSGNVEQVVGGINFIIM